MRLIRRHKKFSGILAFFAIASASALAAWLISSSGGGATKIGTLAAPVVTAGTVDPGTALLPGGDAAAFVSVQNTNAVPLTITGVSEGGTDADATGFDPFDCPASNMSVNTLSGLTVNVPANATTTVSVPGAFHLKSTAPTGCQGKTVGRKLALSFQAGS